MKPKQKGTVFISGNKSSAEDFSQSNVPSPEEQLTQLAENSERALFELKSLFPFQLFPDKIIITPNIVTVVHKTLFFKNVFPMLIANINSIILTRGLVFSSIKFEVSGYEENPGPVLFLLPKEADKAKRMILGLVDAVKKNIQVEKIEPEEAVEKLERIGRVHERLESWA